MGIWKDASKKWWVGFIKDPRRSEWESLSVTIALGVLVSEPLWMSGLLVFCVVASFTAVQTAVEMKFGGMDDE